MLHQQERRIRSKHSWTAKLDKDVRFLSTGNSASSSRARRNPCTRLTARPARRSGVARTSLEETDIAPVPGTELLLLNLEKATKSRVEAVNLLTGRFDLAQRQDQGSVMQIAVDSELNLIAVVLVKDARNRAREGFKAPSARSCARFEIRRRVVEV